MGIGLVFFGVAEPIQHYALPPVGEGGTIAAAREAMVLTFFLLQMCGLVRKDDDRLGLAPGAEVTTESNPDSVTADDLAVLRAGGINRISFGMQSAVPHVLEVLDRTHDPARVPQVVRWAREAGFDEVSLDLIYGTPGESAEQAVVREVAEAGKLPVVAAIHGYCIGGGTALGWVCDIRLAADNTVFRAADAYLGMLPSWGMGLTRLPRYVGRNRALDILLIGENFGGRDHSTVIHALESVEDMMKTDSNFKNSVDELGKKLKLRVS